jgi:hypothetical protein
VNEIQFQESPVYQNKELKEEQNISEESKSTKIVKEGKLWIIFVDGKEI